MLKKLIFASLLGLYISGPAHGQAITDARALSMSGAFTALARNHVATYYNPANLAMKPSRHFTMVLGLPSMSLDLHNTAFDTGLIKKYGGKTVIDAYGNEDFVGVDLSEQDENDILEMAKDGIGLKTTLGYDIFGLSMGRFAMTVNMEMYAGMYLPRAPLELMFRGNDPPTIIPITDIKGDVYSAAVTSFSYAWPLDGIKPVQSVLATLGITRSSFGVTAKVLTGLANVQMRTPAGDLNFDEYSMSSNVEMTLRMAGTKITRVNDDSLDFDFTPGVLGSGSAFDIGFAAQHGDNLTLGLAVRNIGGKMKWDKDNYEARFTFETEEFNVVDFLLDSDKFSHADTTYSVGTYTVKLPVTLAIGAAYRLKAPFILSLLTKDITAAFDMEKGFSDELGISKDTRLSGGLEMGLLYGLLPLRCGISQLGDLTTTSIGLGLNLPLIKWDLALMNHGLTQTKGGRLATSFWFGF